MSNTPSGPRLTHRAGRTSAANALFLGIALRVAAAYLGSGRTFTRAMQDFADPCADQNQHDYDTFLRAIAEGRILQSHVAQTTT